MGRITFFRLFDYLRRNNIKKSDLYEVLSAPTVSKLGKNIGVTTDTICKLCAFLHCKPEDIMEYEE